MSLNKISFDYDGTLGLPNIESYCKELIDRGNIEVWVVTSRVSDETINNTHQPWLKPNSNDDLWETCERLNIPKERVVFTEHVDKIEYLRGEDFVFHLDDDIYELMEILESEDKCIPINVGHYNWREHCEDAITDIN
jgi:hypothetical protein